jgi:cystathionine beta-lyase
MAIAHAKQQTQLGPLSLQVEHRGAATGGAPTLRVRGPEGRELLRFDCFRDSPHYHVGAGDPIAAGIVEDPVSWAIEALATGLGELALRGGFTGPLDCSDAEVDAALREIEPWLRNPPVELDDLDPALLHSRVGEKWNTYPSDITPAWVAEMDFPLAEPIRVVLERAVDRWDIGYPINPQDTGLRECFSERMERLWGWRTDPRRVEILSDVVQGLYLGVMAFTEPGDGAVIHTPIYPPFFGAVRDTGRRLVEHRLLPASDTNPGLAANGFALDVERLRETADAGTRILLLCNPHNPTGRVFRRDELEALAALARERDWIVLTDEIHQDLVFDGAQHVPFATLDDDAASRTITITSATKAFNIPGLRCAVAHFPSAALQRRWNAVVPRHVRGGIGLLGIYATIAAWRHSDPWLHDVRAYLEANRDFALQFLAREIPEILCQPPESTYLAWLDCRQLDLEPSPARFWYERANLALSDGSNFSPDCAGWARLNFATSRSILRDVLERMAKAVRSR